MSVSAGQHQPSTSMLGYMMRDFERRKDFFSPIDGHRYLEILKYSDGTGLEFHEGSLSEDLISHWLLQEEALPRGNVSMKSRLRVLILPPRALYGTRTLPLSKKTVQTIQDVLHVPNSYFRAYYEEQSVAIRFKPVKSSSSTIGFIFRSEAGWDWDYCLCVVHDCVSQTTHAICMGMNPEEIHQFREYLVVSRAFSVHPLFVSIAIADLTSLIAGRRIDSDEAELNAIRVRIKTDIHIYVDKNTRITPEEANFGEITLQLTSLSASSAALTSFLTTQLRVIDIIGGNLLQEQGHGGQNQDQSCSHIVEELTERVSFIKEALQSARQYNQYNAEVTQAQVQTVYNLTSQRDSGTNLKISRLAARQNHFNMIIASATRRDSIDMRVIAGVTLVFLPGTFTATIFSSSFWNFQPSNNGRVVSPWIWLYCVVTGVLTLIVLALWRYLSRTQYKAIRDLPDSEVPIDKEMVIEEDRD
ncbi:hypothetical protein CPB86DRAFT_770930 [Serendipita vermifera]|nr:hypothetical protein CPB86DRAFT_770930 [Serendipita vermifera]